VKINAHLNYGSTQRGAYQPPSESLQSESVYVCILWKTLAVMKLRWMKVSHFECDLRQKLIISMAVGYVRSVSDEFCKDP